eukprot:Awhi_evm1s5947
MVIVSNKLDKETSAAEATTSKIQNDETPKENANTEKEELQTPKGTNPPTQSSNDKSSPHSCASKTETEIKFNAPEAAISEIHSNDHDAINNTDANSESVETSIINVDNKNIDVGKIHADVDGDIAKVDSNIEKVDNNVNVDNSNVDVVHDDNNVEINNANVDNCDSNTTGDVNVTDEKNVSKIDNVEVNTNEKNEKVTESNDASIGIRKGSGTNVGRNAVESQESASLLDAKDYNELKHMSISSIDTEEEFLLKQLKGIQERRRAQELQEQAILLKLENIRKQMKNDSNKG